MHDEFALQHYWHKVLSPQCTNWGDCSLVHSIEHDDMSWLTATKHDIYSIRQ